MDSRLQEALEATYLRYGRNQIFVATKEMLNDNKFGSLTNDGEKMLRKKVIEAVREGEIDIQKEFLVSYIYSILSSPRRTNELEEAIYQTYEKYKNASSVISDIYRMLDNHIRTGEGLFTRDNGARMALWQAGYTTQDILGFIAERTLEPLIQQIEKERHNPITNIQLNRRNMARVTEKMISGLTHDVEGSIALSGMNATIDIGKRRTNQEDAVLLKIHPQIPEFKILVVSDGVGGSEKGERASHLVVEKINEWFGKLSNKYYDDIEILKLALNKKIEEIDRQVRDEYLGSAGATIVCAIVGREETLIANIGDSRAYGVKDGKLTQFTRDDSLAQEYYEMKFIEKRDDMRFFTGSNKITQSIGLGQNPQTNLYTVPNAQYDQLLLFSDGVTDCLSDNEILAITKNSPRGEVSKRIVNAALENDSLVRKELENDPMYFPKINGGKDNTTAAVYER